MPAAAHPPVRLDVGESLHRVGNEEFLVVVAGRLKVIPLARVKGKGWTQQPEQDLTPTIEKKIKLQRPGKAAPKKRAKPEADKTAAARKPRSAAKKASGKKAVAAPKKNTGTRTPRKTRGTKKAAAAPEAGAGGRLVGLDAIRHAEQRHLTLNSYASDAGPARVGVTADEAREIYKKDPLAVYLDT